MTKERVVNVLLELGVDPSVRGFGDIVEAEMLLLEKPDMIHAITKELYPEVAKRNKSTAARVERNIRLAKEKAMNEDVHYTMAKKLKVQNCMFKDGNVKNGRFLGALMQYLMRAEGNDETA